MNERKSLFIKENDLYIGNVKASQLANEYKTPLYVVDEQYIVEVLNAFTTGLNAHYGYGKISYASKAFCCKEIYRILKANNVGTDVVSMGELFTALSVDFDAKNIIHHGNNKTFEELEYAISNNVGLIVVDAISEVEDISVIAKKSNKIVDVLLRVNPGIEAHTHHYIQTAKPDSKFGFSIASGEAEGVINIILRSENVNLKGLHCHIGSQIFDNNSFVLAVDKMAQFYKYLLDKFNLSFDILNLGGGFGIYYNDEDNKVTPNDYQNAVKLLSEQLNKCIEKYNIKKPYLILEPGRSVVGEAGITLYTIGRIKKIKDLKNYISIDGGMFENPRFALYQAKYSAVLANRASESATEKYTVAGKCCESGDIIIEDISLPMPNEGDIMAVFSTGAYNYSMASNYNRNLIPAVVMVKDGKSKLIVKRQTLDNLVLNDI